MSSASNLKAEVAPAAIQAVAERAAPAAPAASKAQAPRWPGVNRAVDAAIRATDLSRRHAAGFSRSIGEPLSLRRDQFVRWFLETDARHALLLEGDIVPPEDAHDRAIDSRVSMPSRRCSRWRVTRNKE